MNILFLHRGFTGQFKYLAPILAQNPNNLVLFITADTVGQFSGINKLPYAVQKITPSTKYPFMNTFHESILHGQGAANIAVAMKEKGIVPDIIIGHSWGPTMFIKDIFPDVPMLCYFEWYENFQGAAIGFDGKPVNFETKIQIRTGNVDKLIDLYSCDAGICPTHWQKEQFPKEFHDKIRVIHDGIDSEACKPDKNAKLSLPSLGLEFSAKDEIITYATRGMEPYRGFPQAMEAIEKLQKKRPNAHFLIGGLDKTFYGDYLKTGTYKEKVLNRLKLDKSRVHFIGELNFVDYLKLLQISSVHIYATVPFVLSWSILEAMSVGCCIVASNTKPVQEVMQDNYNGLLYDFYDVNQLIEKIEYALDNKDKIQTIRENARKTVIEKYEVRNMIAQQVSYINEIVTRKN